MFLANRYFMGLKCALLIFSLIWGTGFAQSFPLSSYSGLSWRCIGPHRGGRTVAGDGDPVHPNVMYIGVNNGGVWKTTDYGRTWKPIFDNAPTGSVGCLAVAPSDPKTIYVGSGEGLQRPDLSVGDGVYKTTDGGANWHNTGLQDGQQMTGIVVHPKDKNRVAAAVLGHPYGPNAMRGVFRSFDGGTSWERCLFVDEDTGASAIVMDPNNPDVLYAAMWSARQAPWENGQWQGPGTGLYKSTDFGKSWKAIMNGLPRISDGLGRIGVAVAPSNSNVVYATVDSRTGGGIYRSDDGGEHWKLATSEARVWARGSDFAEIDVDPRNENVVYCSAIAVYKSVDGAKTFRCIRGAPGGDDYHTLWINPKFPDVMLLCADQGAIVSVNGGETWSSWYNQPTAQFYHVITDNQFPYNVYGGQQESGSVGIASRGNDGQITFREWHPVGADEYAYIAPDPLNPNIVYGGRVTRYHKDTGVVENCRPPGPHRYLRTAPLMFSEIDPHVLYFAGEVLFKTTDGAKTWQQISPDLTRETYDVPKNIGVFAKPEMASMPRRGVIYAIAPSRKNLDTIWCGSDDGLIQMTKDGGRTWQNVTPSPLTPWSKVSQLDASHFDDDTCYAAVDRMRLDDWQPHIYKTHDGGKTWTEIVRGIPQGEPVRTIREDPKRKGLLFCGTERAVYFSTDDGEHWNPLRLNMPATSIRDLVIHQSDLVVGTHGRSFWILDDIAPLRELQPKILEEQVHLFAPETALRVEWNRNTDTPLPPEEPAGKNPPDGAPIDYWLKLPVTKLVLEILDANGNLIRRFSSDDKAPPVDEKALQISADWIRPFQRLSTAEGMHRFVWDLRSAPSESGPARFFPMTAVIGDTPFANRAPMVQPGVYKVRLTANGIAYEMPIIVKEDPRLAKG